MKNIILIGLLFVFSSGLQAAIKKSNLRILYVGGTPEINTMLDKVDSLTYARSASQRMASFEKMLKQYFKYVTVIHAKDYNYLLSNDYDVTIMDGVPRPLEPKVEEKDASGRIVKRKRAAYLPQDFSRPMLLIAELSSEMGSRIGLKTDWYCLCLDADAHHMRMEHPIFHGPFPVKMTIVQKPTPELGKFEPYFKGGPTPDSIPMWRVRKDSYGNVNNGIQIRIGLVSRPGGFEDSPEAEFISGGVSAKTLDAVAIGRHGNFFHWGFAASPADMTEEAKSVFANAIVYISQFDGQKPIARKYDEQIITRDVVKKFAYRATREAYEKSLARDERYDQMKKKAQQAIREKQAKGGTLNDAELLFLNYQTPKQKTREEFLQDNFPELYFLFGTDEKGYIDYFRNNAAYFLPKPGQYDFIIDEDARSLGIANNDIHLLDKAIELMERGIDPAKGLRLLKRYTLCRFETPEEWRAWFEANKSRLFFTESGGWYFLVNTREKDVLGNDYSVLNDSPLSVSSLSAETDDNNPVLWVASVENLPNGNRQIVIRVKIHPGYHIYARVAESDPFISTTVDFRLPEGVEKVGGLKQPSSKVYNSAGTEVYEKEGIFCQEIQGAGEIICIVDYQCCNDQICMPPAKIELRVK